MPNRIIKESLCASDRIASLTDFEFRLWVGLITRRTTRAGGTHGRPSSRAAYSLCGNGPR